MNTLGTLSDNALLESYYKAIELNLSVLFIQILISELKARKITISY